MSLPPLFPRFDGLMHLAKRDGVDIRPTLLRVLTDLYVQSPSHNDDEQRQYTELASRLIDEVDDATRASIRARLSIYCDTPPSIARQLGLPVAAPSIVPPPISKIPDTPNASSESAVANSDSDVNARQSALHIGSRLALMPSDALAIDTMFTDASPRERVLILRSLEDSPIRPAARGNEQRNNRAVATLEKAALASDAAGFSAELASALLLRPDVARRIVADASGELLVCAAKALGMSDDAFQRVLLFLKPEIGNVVNSVYRLSRLYETLNERSALIMVAAWRGATVANTRAKYQAVLYDDTRRRPRQDAASRHQPASISHTSSIRSRG